MIALKNKAVCNDVASILAMRVRLQTGRPVSLAEIMDDFGLEQECVYRDISDWLRTGQLEILQPTDTAVDSGADAWHPLDTFFRWRCSEDDAYQWEQSFFEGRRSTAAYRWTHVNAE